MALTQVDTKLVVVDKSPIAVALSKLDLKAASRGVMNTLGLSSILLAGGCQNSEAKKINGNSLFFTWARGSSFRAIRSFSW